LLEQQRVSTGGSENNMLTKESIANLRHIKITLQRIRLELRRLVSQEVYP
jgi:hypothetical protein